ncbi:hypothetical protein LSM04_002565 [Trypanosoma melophagium]|uniref:uncharacterized protein n=1 Tax=Trypanosoma melophagium TaxID=715481 RepID=UPI003519E7EF|nr:hypothetical protein LSM04_002565 [Trypanosoma melophagium]
MAERESTAEVETTARIGLRSSSVLGNSRKEPADVISSPELTRRASTSKHRAAGEGVKEKVLQTRSSGKTSLRIQDKKQQQSESNQLTTSRKLQRIDYDHNNETDTDNETENTYDDDDVKPSAPTRGVALHTVWSEKTTNTSCISENDSLLERLREKEKQFDEKITTLDETLWCAERGRMQRDSIIENLRAEIARLRSQLDLANTAKSQTEELRERILKERTIALEEARAKIEELDDCIRKKDIRIRQLEMEKEKEVKLQSAVNLSYRPEVAENLATIPVGRSVRQKQQQQQQRQKSSKIHHIGIGQNNDVKDKQEKERERHERYNATLRAMQEEVNALERNHNVTRREREALAEENHALRCKLEAIQDGMESRVAEAMKVMRNNIENRREMESEIVATRLSMARLLRLLSEVPEMRRYLRVNDIDGEMIFVGYSAATMASKTRKTKSSLATKMTNNNNDDDMHRRRHISSFPGVLGTGVDDGIYGGNTQLQSCNVYLNGQWCKQLQEIIDDENYFLRRSKIHIGDLEETSRGGRGDSNLRVPSPSDVLQGRQHDKDFWIPYAVFVEAQKFKNRYFPSLSHEYFYPFLIVVNKIWNEKMKYRLAAETRRLHEQQQQQKRKQCGKNERENDFISFGDSSRLLSSSASALWRQLQTLRGEVRRRVTGKNSLELFNLYDQLTRCTLEHLKNVQTEHASLLEEHQYRHRLERARAEIGLGNDYDKIDSKNERQNASNIDTGETVDILRRALLSLAEEVQDVSERASSRLATSCHDLQQFLSALRDQQIKTDSSEHQNSHHHELTRDENLGISQAKTAEYIPVLTLFRIIDGVLGFVEEVEREVLTAKNAISRCTARVEEKSELLLVGSDIDNDSDTEVEEEDDDYDYDSEDYNNVNKRG